MKKEARALMEKAIDSLVLSVECFNRPWDRGRPEAVLILLDHAFELLLKAAIIHRGGAIRERRGPLTDGFDLCVRKALTGPHKFLSEEDALLLQAINGLRDAAQHHLVYVSEQHLYIQCQAGLTLFSTLMDRVFAIQLSTKLPDRVLPVSTHPPIDLVALFRNEVAKVKELLQPGRRQRLEATTRLRGLAIVDSAMRGEKLQPSDRDLSKLANRVSASTPWEQIFPGVAAINITASGHGPSFDFKITKREGIPVYLVPEGTPGATTVAVKRVNELGFYNLSHTDLARKLGITQPRLVAMIRYLRIQNDSDCYKLIVLGGTKIQRYSQHALARVRAALDTVDVEEVWINHGPVARKKVATDA
jgi:hypothetical protein